MSKKNKFNKNVSTKVERETVQCDIVIPIYSNYELAEKCIQAIPGAFPDVNYKIYLVDDKSPEYEEKGKEFLKHLRLNLPNMGGIVERRVNGGFGKACNDGAAMGRGKTVCILSTDVLLQEGAGKIQVEHLLGSPELGIVFPKLLFFPNSTNSSKPAGKVQGAGTVFDITLTPYHMFLGWDADHPRVNRVVDYNACTGATFIIRKDLWFNLKGFDINYGSGTFEDVDICIRTRMAGYKIRYLPMAVGYHGVGLSFEKTNTPAPLNKNFNYFKAKFGENIPYDDWMR